MSRGTYSEQSRVCVNEVQRLDWNAAFHGPALSFVKTSSSNEPVRLILFTSLNSTFDRRSSVQGGLDILKRHYCLTISELDTALDIGSTIFGFTLVLFTVTMKVLLDSALATAQSSDLFACKNTYFNLIY